MTRPAPSRLDPSAYPITDEIGTRYQDLDAVVACRTNGEAATC